MGTEPIRSFEDLDCWKACRVLRIFVARVLCKALPKDERYRLGDQILRAARSTTANIAEGYGRFHYLDNAKFCSNARGSAWEVMDHIITAEDEELAPLEITTEARSHVQKAVALLNGYIAYLRRAASTKTPLEEGSPPITSNK
ncbi:MAG: four helix bundle protein [Luteolibacter sp.]